MTRCLLTVCLLLPIATALAQTDELESREARLETLREQIGELQDRLAEDRERAGGLEAELAELEQRIGRERQALSELDAQIRSREQRIAELESAIATQSRRSEAHRERLAESLRATHRQGESTALRLVLNAEDPARLQRLLVYQQVLAGARSEQVRQAESAIRRLRDQRAEREAALDAQQADRDERETRLSKLEADLSERDALLAEIRGRIRDRDTRLEARRDEAETLNGLIEDLREQLASTGPAPGRDAEMATGALAWPHEGPLLAQYGGQRAGDLEWTGLLIGGESGDPVRPVAPGQVVFADWLRGSGLLLIIDHGAGYLSLYGRNESLYVDVGDRVAATDVIATVGRSGGRAEPALYFELRADGEPVDPLVWLRSRDNQG
ncbi:murein hydrolase activator EnvC family protein [Spiribacter vilamensis]|uniref:Septal ring factor EnvC (AmiA/AmiB activator) n=1 Tax=Spiribacter vilamensis TaxID=531306 RepID=A0A4Q8D2H3_9GAMM|nr:peptidoglycan DD-metalloendopeptidase family protein [Spiribacter vilamensis]RZU99507.1 septal ring factor EnvC (AmiA/AmiB activator) [Spiribacter vilamensis]TVO61521.1 peptidoglycan DD-metalloendopeptidase family protein [Spiribacter vilamensis]